MTFVALGLTSLSMIIHVAANGIISLFLWLGNSPSHIYTYIFIYHIFIYLFVDGQIA